MDNRENSAEINCVRLFIGIRPDTRTQRFLEGLASHAQQMTGNDKQSSLRWISHSNRHLTLAFLGETPISLIPVIEGQLRQMGEELPACDSRIVTLSPFPQQRSRLLAAELLTNPALDRLHERCRQLMIGLGMKPESASYRPHFTLARSKRGLSRFEPLPVDFTVRLDNLVLYQSLMAPGGSQYQPLLEVSLRDTPVQ